MPTEGYVISYGRSIRMDVYTSASDICPGETGPQEFYKNWALEYNIVRAVLQLYLPFARGCPLT